MTKLKVEKIIVISFIGLIVAFFVGLGGNFLLKAGLPTVVSKTKVDFENRLLVLENNLAAGTISRNDYDSLAEIIRVQKAYAEAPDEELQVSGKLPEWVTRLGISEPENMKFDRVFSDFTSIDNPTEGFNSVSMIYTGSYEIAVKEASRIAAEANLSPGGNFKAKGAPVAKDVQPVNSGVSYMNYSLANANKDFLISIEVEPSGRLSIIVTDIKQLNERLVAYAPLNNRQNSASKLKKQ